MKKDIDNYFKKIISEKDGGFCKYLSERDKEFGRGHVILEYDNFKVKIFDGGFVFSSPNIMFSASYEEISSIGVLTLPDIIKEKLEENPFKEVDFFLLEKDKANFVKMTLPFPLYSAFYNFIHKYCSLKVIPRVEAF